jgi:hypothetical protein
MVTAATRPAGHGGNHAEPGGSTSASLAWRLNTGRRPAIRHAGRHAVRAVVVRVYRTNVEAVAGGGPPFSSSGAADHSVFIRSMMSLPFSIIGVEQTTQPLSGSYALGLGGLD